MKIPLTSGLILSVNSVDLYVRGPSKTATWKWLDPTQVDRSTSVTLTVSLQTDSLLTKSEQNLIF